MIFAPRSCPSRPGFAMTMRIGRSEMAAHPPAGTRMASIPHARLSPGAARAYPARTTDPERERDAEHAEEVRRPGRREGRPPGGRAWPTPQAADGSGRRGGLGPRRSGGARGQGQGDRRQGRLGDALPRRLRARVPAGRGGRGGRRGPRGLALGRKGRGEDGVRGEGEVGRRGPAGVGIGGRHRRVRRGLRRGRLPLRPLQDGRRRPRPAGPPGRPLPHRPLGRPAPRRPRGGGGERCARPLQHAGQPPHADDPGRAREGAGRRHPGPHLHRARAAPAWRSWARARCSRWPRAPTSRRA